VLHDHDDESARLLLRRAHDALAPGGRLLIAEPMAATRGAEPIGDAYFGFYLLAMGRGRARSTGEISSLMTSAGFTAAKSLRTPRPLLASAVTALRV
jgi:demethylspheroidene O-methyltransferase